MLSRIFILWIIFTLGLFAVEGDYSAQIVEKERYFVSEELVLKVDLKTTAFSIKDAKIGLENSKDYIVVTPKSAAFLETIEINGTQWQIVHYEYKLYPLHAGKMTIAPMDMAFKASMGYGTPDTNFTFQSNALILDVAAPEGVGKNDFVLSTPSYTLKSEFSPKLSETNASTLKVGDAIEIKIIQEAKNVPDILLEPARFSENPHLKLYKEEPILKGKEGESIATRIDSFTFVAAKEGNVTIPSQKFIWWNPAEQVLHRERTAELHLVILPNPQETATELSDKKQQQDKTWIFILLSAFLIIVLLYKLYPYAKRWRKKQKLAYQESEEGRFSLLLDSCQGDNMTKLYQDFYDWLEVADSKLSRAGFRGISELQPSFSNSLSQLERALADPEQAFDKIEFVDELQKFSGRLLKGQQSKQQSLPKYLNPN